MKIKIFLRHIITGHIALCSDVEKMIWDLNGIVYAAEMFATVVGGMLPPSNTLLINLLFKKYKIKSDKHKHLINLDSSRYPQV